MFRTVNTLAFTEGSYIRYPMSVPIGPLHWLNGLVAEAWLNVPVMLRRLVYTHTDMCHLNPRHCHSFISGSLLPTAIYTFRSVPHKADRFPSITPDAEVLPFNSALTSVKKLHVYHAEYRLLLDRVLL